MALRFCFGSMLTPGQLKELQEYAIEYHNQELAMAREQAREAKKEGDDFAVAALDFAINYNKAALSWLKTVPVK